MSVSLSLCDPLADFDFKKKRKVAEIYQALNSDPIDVAALRRMAISEGGLLTDEIRRKVWPKLLSVNEDDLPPLPGTEQPGREGCGKVARGCLVAHTEGLRRLTRIFPGYARAFPTSSAKGTRAAGRTQQLDALSCV